MPIGVILDILIVILLGATIFYAARLSIHLKTFRDARSDMDDLLDDLSEAVIRAENAIKGMNNSAQQSGQKLQDVINEAKFLADELRFMNESGDNLASRLEKLAERNRELVDLLEQAGGVGHPVQEPFHKKVRTQPVSQGVVRPQPKAAKPVNDAFAIQDRDYEEDFMDDDFDDQESILELKMMLEPEDQKPSASPSYLKSQAERDLYEALRRKTAQRRKRDSVT